MRTIIKINVSLITLVALAACDQGTGSGAPLIPGPKEEACLSAVASATGVSELVLLDAADTRSGRNVIVGVGPQQVQYSCVAYDDGTTSQPTRWLPYGIL